MTELGVALLILGAVVVVAEAHVQSLGILGVPGVIALGAGSVLAVSGLGGGLALAVVIAVLLVAVGIGVVALSLTKGMAVRRRRVRAGPEGLIGHVGVVRSWAETNGCVLVDGTLWRARQSILEDDAEPDFHVGDTVVVDHMSGLTVGVRRAEEWELTS
jgi:membrane-bound serine protease (ClpP class)